MHIRFTIYCIVSETAMLLATVPTTSVSPVPATGDCLRIYDTYLVWQNENDQWYRWWGKTEDMFSRLVQMRKTDRRTELRWHYLVISSTDIGIYDLVAVASLTFHELDCQHTEDVRSVMLDRLLGTLFLSVSTTMHCLCLTVVTSSNISTSRPTSTLSAFEVLLTVNVLYKFPTYWLTCMT